MADPFTYDPNKLAEEQAAADSKKLWLNSFGSVADSLANIPSQADIMLGRTPQKLDAGAGFRAAAASVQDPTQVQAKKYQMMKDAQAAKMSSQQSQDYSDARDPNSEKSKSFRQALSSTLPPQVLEKMGDSFNNISAADKDLVFDPIKLKETIDARKAQSALLAQSRKDAQSSKMDDKLDKMASALKDDLDPNKARGGNLAKSQAMINASDRVNALFEQFPDYNVPKAQTIELSSAIAGLITGGSPQSQHQIDSLTPSSLRGDFNAIAGWITNDPRGLEQKEFMKAMHDTAVRERETAVNQVKTAQRARLAAHDRFKRADPELYGRILGGYGLEESPQSEPGKIQAQPPQAKFPMVVRKGPKQATVQNEQELGEAMQEGFR